MSDQRKFVPQTAREALLEIRTITLTDPKPSYRISWIDVVADQGLTRTEPYNFELSDHLADRLAEAHRLLKELEEVALTHTNDAEIVAKIPAVLSLPPDLEAMVERRIGR